MFDHSVEDKSLYIQKRYPISTKEYKSLDEKYGKLCWYAAQKLTSSIRRGCEDLDDFHSEIVIGMCRAGSYYKRQIYIEGLFKFFEQRDLQDYISCGDQYKLETIQNKWTNKKSSFQETDENELIALSKKYTGIVKQKQCGSLPKQIQPLTFSQKFQIYCKAIIWNTCKSLGQQINKENMHRCAEISLDEWGFLEGGETDSHHQKCFSSDIRVLKNKLESMEDQRPLQTFNILTDPQNQDEVFKQKQSKNGEIKINVVRKKTKMSYRTINKMLTKIKKVAKQENIYE